MASTEGSDKQLQVRFVTKLEKYGVEDMPLSIPVTAEPDTLNQLLAELLSVSLGSISALPEFDFLVSGEFLRTSLGTLIEEKGLNTEDVVEIEYVEKLPAPEPFQSLTHDDWVASVHTNGQWILSGCYDNVVHIWNERAKHLLAIPGHGGPVKAVRWLPSSGDPKEGLLFVSASHDQTVRLWRWFPDKNVATPIFIGCGHARSVEALATEPSGRMIASGSFDSMLKIWSADPDEGGEAGDAKKSKGDASSVEKRVPLMTLSGHAEAISAISWMTPDEICTVSWDQTIRLWDAEMGSNKTQLAGTRAFLACDWSKLRSGPALLTASADRHIRLYDPRSPEGNLVKLTFTTHSGWITCVRWSESREDLFISGGHDQMLRLWDIRSPKVALYELQGHEDKIMCCDWSVPTRVASGGADNSVKIYSVKPDAGKPV